MTSNSQPPPTWSRRKLLASLGAAGAVLAASSLPAVVKARGADTLIHDVKEYGALGQGGYGDQDWTGIQQAVTAAARTGGFVYIPAGTYLLTKPVQLQSGVHLIGAGAALTHLIGATGCVFTALPPAGSIEIGHLSIQGGSAGSKAFNEDSAVSLLQASSVRIYNCRFHTVYSPILLRSCTRCIIENNEFDIILGNMPGKPHYGTAVFCAGGEGHLIRYNTFRSVSTAAAWLGDGCSASTIEGNRVSFFDSSAFVIQSDDAKKPVSHNRITANHITNENASKTGCTAIRLTRNVLLNHLAQNSMEHMDGIGIVLEGDQENGKLFPADNTITGNDLRHLTGSAVVLQNALRTISSGNSVRNCTLDGICIESRGEANSRDSVLSGNILVGCKETAIRIKGAKSSGTLLAGNSGSGNGKNLLDEGTHTQTAATF
ncbi:glycosyl hydrolase family 28-related protein [Paenibacillus lutrae]|uniref:Tat pathway signal protein n=1 Tax=Paenibacillus lutrae TaxID=2078573 RepID=A0A7X3FI02_9BACL|nr:right-handed parallel beta-helix repeat-containing protein [Paenibacillus lutrae]MVO99981.1 Tat pathway signal protein [Paenibacillus lutrae]